MGPGSMKRPKPLLRLPEKERVCCIGYHCWRKGKTFMSPDPKRIRMCSKCQVHANAQREPKSQVAHRKSVKGGRDG